MSRVGIADLKARLSTHLKQVRRGRSITVLDRETPVARIVPVATSTLDVRAATRKPADLRSTRIGVATGVSSLDVLLDDRRRR